MEGREGRIKLQIDFLSADRGGVAAIRGVVALVPNHLDGPNAGPGASFVLQVQIAHELRITDLAEGVDDIVGEQGFSRFQLPGRLAVDREPVAPRQVVGITRCEIDAPVGLFGDVDELAGDGVDPVRSLVTDELAADRVGREIVREVAGRDGSRAQAGDLVLDLDLEIIDRSAEVDELRRPDQTYNMGRGRFRLKLSQSAALEQRRRTAGPVVGPGHAAARSVRICAVVGQALADGAVSQVLLPVDAGIHRALAGEAALVGQIQFEQSRGSERRARGGAHANVRQELPVHADLVGRCAARRLGVGHPAGQAEVQAIGERHILQNRDRQFGEDFGRALGALGDAGAGRTPGVGAARDFARDVVDFVVTNMEAEGRPDRAGWQVEQLATHEAFNIGLFIDSVALVHVEQEGALFISQITG